MWTSWVGELVRSLLPYFVITGYLSKGVVVNYMVTVSIVTMAVSGLVIMKVWKP